MMKPLHSSSSCSSSKHYSCRNTYSTYVRAGHATLSCASSPPSSRPQGLEEARCHLRQKSPVQQFRVRRGQIRHASFQALRGVEAFQRLVHAAVSFADEGRHAEAGVARLDEKAIHEGRWLCERETNGVQERRTVSYGHAFCFWFQPIVISRQSALCVYPGCNARCRNCGSPHLGTTVPDTTLLTY